jgi:VWFA-related protein
LSLAVLGVLALAATRFSTAAAQDQAVFRSGVDLMTVDATVIAADGMPKADLAASDFVLRVDGRPRRVVSAQFVRHTRQDTPAPPRRTHFSSNEFVDVGRFVVVAVDEPHVRRIEGRSALSAAGRFIEQLDPRDHVAVLGLGRGGSLDFTRDRVAARSRLMSLVGQGDPAFIRLNIGLAEAVEIADGGRARLAEVVLRECGRALTEYLNPARAADDANNGGRDACPEQVEQEARATAQYARTQAKISLSALEGLIATLAELNRPSTLVLLSEGMVADPRLMDFTELAAAAQLARVTIYVLHMETPLFEASTDRVSPTFLRDVQMRSDGLERLAGSARGAVFRLVGSDPAPFHRIATELSGHYLIAFEPLAAERDGRVHRIELSVSRRGHTVRARHAFRLPATVATPRAREQELATLLRSTLPATELPVRVATYTYVEPVSAQLRVVVSTEADALQSADGLVLGYVLVDGRGVIVASGAHRTTSGRHAFTTRVPRGNYTLRVGGIDRLGRRGMVERSFTAAVHQQQHVQVSDLILAPVPASADAPLHPIVDRVEGPSLVAYLELAAAASHPLDDLDVQLEIVTDAAVAETSVQARASVTQSGRLWARARGELSLASLSRGRYIAIAHVFSGEQEVARASRPFTVP